MVHKQSMQVHKLSKYVQLGSSRVHTNSSTFPTTLNNDSHKIHFFYLIKYGCCTVGGQKIWLFWFRSEKKFNFAHFESLWRDQKLIFYLEIFTINLNSNCQYAYQFSKPNNSPKKNLFKIYQYRQLWKKFHSYQLRQPPEN